ncbi:hypothetical protein D3C76_1172140 [compost metagenome]
MQGLALGQRLLGKGVIAFMQQGLQQRMLGMVSLQHDFALLAGTPGAACHLGIELGKALCGAEIRREQRAVNVQQRHQRHVREVVPFRQHLGANQDPRSAAMHFRQLLLKRPLAAGGVAVDTRDRHAGEEGG